MLYGFSQAPICGPLDDSVLTAAPDLHNPYSGNIVALQGTTPEGSPTLFSVQSSCREINIRGVEDVTLRVTGAASDEAAFQRVRDVLAMFQR